MVKSELAQAAKRHTEIMEQFYKEDIKDCIDRTKIYRSVPSNNTKRYDCTEFIYEDLTSEQAVEKYASVDERVCVLNFASYKHPGGMFLEGSNAQEEALCHASTLYNVLSAFQDSYYDYNCEHKNNALYTDASLYSPGVLFFSNDSHLMYSCDVLTCAAPNAGAAKKYCDVSDMEIYAHLSCRIRHIISVAVTNKVDTFILGAWGCGVFKNDPYVVAKLFDKYITPGLFKRVIYAIPDSKNALPFKKICNR